MSKTKLILRVENLSFVTEGKKIIDHVSFKLYAGEHLAIVGESGGGKSTLLRLLNRLIEPTGGKIYLKGRDYKQIAPRELRRKISLLLQTPYLFPGTVADNIRFGPKQRNENVTNEKVEALLKQVNLAGYSQRKVDKLSGGEKQRVSLARTLANSPTILLLDEPTSSLDKKSQLAVEKLIGKIAKNSRLTFIVVTHNQEQAKRLTKKTILLEKGIIKNKGLTKEIVNAQ